MEVNNALVEKVARLARLDFPDSDLGEIRKDMEKMIAFIDKLNELDTTGVEPLLHMNEKVMSPREDEVKGMISREEAFKNAPLHNDEYFIVPKVINKMPGSDL